MGKSVFIAEKPSVAQEFAKALKSKFSRNDGFLESEEYIVTWCVGHLVTMSYPEKYDERMKRWSLETLPFLPKEFRYEVIPAVLKQFETVKGLLNRADIDTIYVCTDSGREGEYIYRLVEQMAGVKNKQKKRVWIDSQTEEEIIKGIQRAKDLSDYDCLAAAAYLRAKEDYLMGINFSRLLTLKYGKNISSFLRTDRTVISVGRVMTCVLGMVVRREREIRAFVKIPFYRVLSKIKVQTRNEGQDTSFEAEWRVTEQSRYHQSLQLYKENGFKEEKNAQELISYLSDTKPVLAVIDKTEKKKEVKNPPLLYNLAELQNDCSRMFKISPDQTLQIAQELYEKKLVTYPRTDARVLSTAVCKEIHKNIGGLKSYPLVQKFADEILTSGTYNTIEKSKYCNDKQITDHYAIIPTGQGFGALQSLSPTAAKVYEVIVRRFLSIFYPPAAYQKISIVAAIKEERFFASFKILTEEGYLKVITNSFAKNKDGIEKQSSVEKPDSAENPDTAEKQEENEEKCDTQLFEVLKKLKKGDRLPVDDLFIKEGETSPPKRFNSGSIILAMENAGQFIEDEELRAQIKGSGIGTSATRAEILKKLDHNKYISIHKKTQIITPTMLGEMIFDVVDSSIKHLLNPELTASWEKGLTYVSEGSISSEEYMEKLEDFVRKRTANVLSLNNHNQLAGSFHQIMGNYKQKG